MNWWLDEVPYPDPRVQPGGVHYLDLAGGASLAYTVDPESGIAEIIGTVSRYYPTSQVETFIRERYIQAISSAIGSEKSA